MSAFVFAVSLLLAALARISAVTSISEAPSFSVAAYLPEWRYEGANWETIAQHTTHLILFSLEIAPNGDIAALDRFPRPTLWREARSATRKKGCKLLICFGGNGRSSGFSPMTRSKSARANFLRNLASFFKTYDLGQSHISTFFAHFYTC